MNFLISIVAFCVVVSAAQAGSFVDTASPTNVTPLNEFIGSNWVLDFSDEFQGDSLDSTKWRVDRSRKSRNPRKKLGIKDWRWIPENVALSNGELVLKVSKTDDASMRCGSINSNNLYETQYGYFEARIKIADASKGTHTAFWLTGDNMGNVDGTANDGAEIDIFESAWLGDYTKSVLHIDGYGRDHKANTKRYDTPGIHDGYHVWGMHWTKDFIKIYYDGDLKVTYEEPKWLVHAPEFLWLSVGASFGFEGDHFKVAAEGHLTEAYFDYVRVWKEL